MPTLKQLAKGKGEKAEQAREMLELSGVEDNEEEDEEEFDSIECIEDILGLYDELPISEMDDLIDNDPIEEAREILGSYGEDELQDLKKELEEKVAERKRVKEYVVVQGNDFQSQIIIKAHNLQEAQVKALKSFKIKIKQSYANKNKGKKTIS